YTNVPGGYVIRVADDRGCEFYSGVVTITNPIPATISATVTSATCYGENNGVVSVTINGGAAPFRIKLNSTDANWTSVTGNKHLFSNVSTGTHNMVVIDANDCQVTKPVFVAAPSQPLRGFAGVSQLVGCGDGVNTNKAKVRFTNVSGGWGEYQYKYDGGFSIYSEGWITPGTHTVTIRDKGGCEYDIRVVVPEKITEPTGTTYTIVTYDCSGKGTIRLTGAPNTYDYTYIIDGKTATGTTATITGLAPGTYTMTIKYKDGNPPASTILIDEDFGVGPDTCSDNVSSAFTCSPNGSQGTAPGRYVIMNRNSPYLPMGGFPSIWIKPNDHTSGGTNPLGRYFFIDIGNVGTGDILYSKRVTDIKPNVPIKYELFLLNLFRPNHGAALPNVEIRLVAGGNTIDSKQSGPIADNTDPDNWIRFAGELNPGSNTSIDIQIRTNAWANWGCDFVMDDIKVYQIPESCAQTITRTVVIPSGQEFK
ncbi:hypothetical protein HMPREF9075_02445, partial [Capnocytophaga sp. oral taxon 332 str. F0381]|uniref:SprB repeat-containing protein n=1 Tax=Capnocytophaga sp. oral taxon 332 TaxID=712213 RepID=UPI0002A2EA2B